MDNLYKRLGVSTMTIGSGLYCLIVTFNNVSDYGTNFQFVKHVLEMDTIFPNSNVMYRSIHQDWFHHLAYCFIISLEGAISSFLLFGAYQITASINRATEHFHRSKKYAYLGIALGIVLWLIGFMVVGGEWFSMWQSSSWNGLDSSDRILTFFVFTYLALVLVD
jgi:predicted small integral membrane protein